MSLNLLPKTLKEPWQTADTLKNEIPTDIRQIEMPDEKRENTGSQDDPSDYRDGFKRVVTLSVVLSVLHLSLL
mgnify:CR=1 FL=1